MTESKLTHKQSYFLERLQEAEQSGLTIVQLAEQENVSTALLYNYRHVLRRKGYLEPARRKSSSSGKARSGFEPVAVPSSPQTDPAAFIELKTQLANGQPVWMSVPAHQLSLALAALSA